MLDRAKYLPTFHLFPPGGAFANLYYFYPAIQTASSRGEKKHTIFFSFFFSFLFRIAQAGKMNVFVRVCVCVILTCFLVLLQAAYFSMIIDNR